MLTPAQGGGRKEGWGAWITKFRDALNDNGELLLSFAISHDPALVCVCVFSSHSFWASSSLDVPAGVTQEEGHTGFFIHLPSAVRALIFLARRVQPFLSLVDREVELIESFSTRWAFFHFLVRKIPFTGIELTSQRVRRLRGYL